MPSQTQWSKLSEYLLQVGAFDEPVPFCVNALERLGRWFRLTRVASTC